MLVSLGPSYIWNSMGYNKSVAILQKRLVQTNSIENKSTGHGCWTLNFFVSDINLQAIYKVIHTSNLSTDWGQHFLQVYWVSS